MYQNTDGKWNNIQLSSLGLQIVKINIDATKETFTSSRKINSDRVKIDKYHYNNYIHSIDRDNMKFTLELASEQILTEQRCEELARAFSTEDFIDFICFENNHIYNCVNLTTDLNVFLNGFHFTLECECSSPYSKSYWITNNYNITETKDITILNNGSIPTFLIAEISPKTTGATIRLTNKTNSGIYFELGTDLNGNKLFQNEKIKINFKKNKITTDALATYRYDNVSNDSNWLFPIVIGKNVLAVTPCELTLMYRYYYLT